jgi:aryl-alcohol dehydrogenase-like predicted oxidoreductase
VNPRPDPVVTAASRAELGIGTAAFLAGYGIGPAAEPPDDLLGLAVERGIRYIDTAADYGDSEAAVGRVVVPGVRVCTKVPAAATIDDVRAAVARLGAAPDTILMHSAGLEQLAGAPAIDALGAARAAGLASRIGASTYGTEAAAFALDQPWCDTIQVEYSVLNQSVLRTLPPTRAAKEIVVRSVLCKGLLTSRRTAAPRFTTPLADALEGLEQCARDWGCTIEALAIRFALDSPGIDVVLVGVSNHAELETALDAAALPRLTRDQWTRLAAFDRSDHDAAHPERWSRI